MKETALSAMPRPKLVEGFVFIAMVLLFIAGTMKGSDVILTFKAFNTATAFESYQAAVREYVVMFNALPGDDAQSKKRFKREAAQFSISGALGQASYEGNGRLDGDLNDAGNVFGEQYTAWRDLRYAGLVSGDPTLVGQSAQPETPFGGLFGFAEENLGLDQVLCATNLPGEAARRVDERMDDGLINEGLFVATSQVDVAAGNIFSQPDTEPYDDTKTYILCTHMMPP